MRPVAVHVGTDASVARARLTVLAPQTVLGGGPDEAFTHESVKSALRCIPRQLTIRVDDGHDVEVILVNDVGDEGILLAVALDELVGHVLDRLIEATSAVAG